MSFFAPHKIDYYYDLILCVVLTLSYIHLLLLLGRCLVAAIFIYVFAHKTTKHLTVSSDFVVFNGAGNAK